MDQRGTGSTSSVAEGIDTADKAYHRLLTGNDKKHALSRAFT
jgi:hypothetical protein